MANHQNTLRLLIPLIALVCLSRADVEAAPLDSDVEAATLDYGVECGMVTPRAVILRVRWPKSASPPATHIDVSFYDDGFTTRRFVSAAVGDLKAVPESGVAMLEAERPTAKQPLELYPQLQSLRLVEKGTEVEAVLGELIPGINYFVRVRGISDEVIRIQAPHCPPVE
jgi:hypothetical protein